MSRLTWPRVQLALGTALLTAALALLVRGLLAGPTAPRRPGVQAATLLLALVGLVVAAWRLRARPDAADDAEGESDGDYRRAARYRLVEPAPERTGIDHPLAGGDGTALLARASEVAREEGDVDAGVAAARPALRGLLRDVLVAGGATEAAAERTIDEGTWTDDATAAAVLSPAVDPPPRPFRERLWTWLAPERAVRDRLDRTVAAMAATAERALPTVPGRSAPRRVSVEPPTLAELKRGVDGSLRPTVTPGAATSREERGAAVTRDDAPPNRNGSQETGPDDAPPREADR